MQSYLKCASIKHVCGCGFRGLDSEFNTPILTLFKHRGEADIHQQK